MEGSLEFVGAGGGSDREFDGEGALVNVELFRGGEGEAVRGSGGVLGRGKLNAGGGGEFELGGDLDLGLGGVGVDVVVGKDAEAEF